MRRLRLPDSSTATRPRSSGRTFGLKPWTCCTGRTSTISAASQLFRAFQQPHYYYYYYYPYYYYYNYYNYNYNYYYYYYYYYYYRRFRLFRRDQGLEVSHEARPGKSLPAGAQGDARGGLRGPRSHAGLSALLRRCCTAEDCAPRDRHGGSRRRAHDGQHAGEDRRAMGLGAGLLQASLRTRSSTRSTTRSARRPTPLPPASPRNPGASS